jgi:AcrR family transcriptional regulator
MPRTQPERSEATRAALVAVARRLFAEQGYNAVGIEAIVREAGLTRGALYHQFEDKAALFAKVFEDVAQELMERLAVAVAGLDDRSTTLDLLQLGIEVWLDQVSDPEVQRIVLLDGPAVLGWSRWRELDRAASLGLVESIVEGAIADGTLDAELSARATTHVFVGALDEAAMYIVGSDDPVQARAEVTPVLAGLLSGILTPKA